MKVSDVMTSSVISLAPGNSMLKAARLMVQYGVSGFPVLSQGKLVGIITQGDFLRRTEIATERPRTHSNDSFSRSARRGIHADARQKNWRGNDPRCGDREPPRCVSRRSRRPDGESPRETASGCER